MTLLNSFTMIADDVLDFQCPASDNDDDVFVIVGDNNNSITITDYLHNHGSQSNDKKVL